MPNDKCQTIEGSRTRAAGRRWGRLFIISHLSFGICLLCGAHEAPLNPDDPAYLRRQYVWFQTVPPARQQQLRKLHEDFLALDDRDRDRLTRVLQTYNAWLARLPEADRRQVLEAPSAAERLEVVRQLREGEWVDALPKPYREEYARLEPDARRQKVQEWRAEEAERREEWVVAQRHWPELQPGKAPPTWFAGDAKPHFEAFAGNLRENLSEPQRRELDEAKAAADDFGNYLWYGLTVVRFADRHPILPGKVGPKTFDALPEQVKAHLIKNDPHFRKKGIIPGGDGEVRELKRAEGRWPEFALELTRYCQKKGLTLPVPLGDCRKDEMPPEVRKFLTETLEPLLKKEKGKVDLRALQDAEGKWPDYPKQIVDLAKRHRQWIPGWTLPGPPQVWDRFRAAKNRPGLVPRP